MQTYTYAEKKEPNEQKYKLLGHEIERVSEEKDIEVTIDEELTFAAIRRSFKYLKVDTILPLYKSMVRSHLVYANSVWAPYKKGIIDQIESVQKRATKQIPALRNLSYKERLQKLKLPTLAYRRIRGDLIEAYAIVHKKYDPDV